MLETVDSTLKCTGYEAHFKVMSVGVFKGLTLHYQALQVLSPRSNSLLCNAGLSHLDLNRCQLHLPRELQLTDIVIVRAVLLADNYRVVLKNDEDYIHASYIDVRIPIHLSIHPSIHSFSRVINNKRHLL